MKLKLRRNNAGVSGIRFSTLIFSPVRRQRAMHLFAAIVVLLTLQGGRKAFGADNGAAVPMEQMSQQVEQLLLTGLGAPPRDTVMKWQDDIRIGLITDNAISADLLGKFGRYISEAQRASGRRIFIFGKDAGFVVVFSEHTQQDVSNHADVLSKFFDRTDIFQKFFVDYENKKQTCAVRIEVGPSDQIYAFLLFLSVSSDRNPKQIDECLRRGMLAGLGVVHAYDEALDPANEQGGGLTKLDILSLKALYDPELGPGAGKDQVLKVVAQVVGSLAK